MKASHWTYSYTFKTPAGTSRGVLTAKPAHFMDVESQGLRGQGECGLHPGLSIDDRPDYAAQLYQICRELSELSDATWADWARQRRLDPQWAAAWVDWPSLVFAVEQALLTWADQSQGGNGLGLQHLAAEAFAQRFPAFGEEAPRHVAQPAAVAAYQEVLFLEAERVGMSGGPGCGGHLRVIASAG